MRTESPLFGFQLDPKAPVTLFEQIYEELRSRIVQGSLRPGERLPASRKMAEELSVSRATILSVYDQLLAEGFVESRKGSGTFVSEIGPIERIPPVFSRASSGAPLGIQSADKKQGRPPLTASEPGAPEDIDRRPTARPFHPGLPDLRLFPVQQWGRLYARLARTEPQALLLPGPAFGDGLLRQEICRYLKEWRGVEAVPEQILITAGASEALELCIRTFLKAGDSIALENPGYPPLYAFVRDFGLNCLFLDRDAQGAKPPSVEPDSLKPEMASPKIVILAPSSQFPLGGAMLQGRRNQFLRWAETDSAWIVEDDYDSEFRYAGQPIPALTSLDTQNRSLYIGSFSKIFSHALRLGFIVVPKPLVPKFAHTMAVYGSKASIAGQRALGLFIAEGHFFRHIRRVRRLYAERRARLMALLQEEKRFDVHIEDHRAGMHVLLSLPDSLCDQTLSQAAARRGLSCPPLSSYYAASPRTQGLLLGFCGFTPSEITESYEILGTLLAASQGKSG